LNVGAKPVIVDSADEDDYSLNINTDTLSNLVVDKEVDCILPVAFTGEPLQNVSWFREFCDNNGIYFVSDLAQALGAEYGSKIFYNDFKKQWVKAGSVEDCSVFSFFPIKNISTGEGGCLATNDEDVYNKVVMYASHGISSKDREKRVPTVVGYNFRMTDILASVGIEQLKKLDGMNKNRVEIAIKYGDRLWDLYEDGKILYLHHPKKSELELLWGKHVFQLYVIRVDEKYRDDLVAFLYENGIQCLIHYDPPIPEIPLYRNFLYDDCRNTVKYSKQVISLPIHPNLEDWEVDYICQKIREFFN